MEIALHRTYFEKGTNGALFCNDQFLGFSIELPWLNNKRAVSCVPEGVYELKARYSKRFHHHLHIVDVKNRSLILFHLGNNAEKDLQGCIAPVSYLSGIGKGLYSKAVLERLVSRCYQAFDRKEKVVLIIKS